MMLEKPKVQVTGIPPGAVPQSTKAGIKKYKLRTPANLQEKKTLRLMCFEKKFF
jgi:hypothetical protein